MTSFLSAVVVGALLFVVSPLVVNLYDISATTASWALESIRYNSVLIWLYSVNVAIYMILRSGGDMKSTILADSVFTWVVMVPVALGLGYFSTMHIPLMFLLIKGTELPKFFYSLTLLKKRRWIQNLTVENV